MSKKKKKTKKRNPLKIRFKWATLIQVICLILQVLVAVYVGIVSPSSTLLKVMTGLAAFIFILMSVVCVSILRYARGIRENEDPSELDQSTPNFIGDTIPLVFTVMIAGLAFITCIVYAYTSTKDEEEKDEFFKYAIYSAAGGSAIVFLIFLYRAIQELTNQKKEKNVTDKLAEILREAIEKED